MRCTDRHAMRRQKSGPTGRQTWMVIVDSCWRCGVMRPIRPTNFIQRDWLRRWNRKVKPLQVVNPA